MKTILAVIGGLALFLVAIVVVAVVWSATTLGPLVKQASAYVDEAIPAIAKSWDREELLKRGTPALKAGVTPETIDHIFNLVRPFGAMTKYNGSKCTAAASTGTDQRSELGANCQASADFEKGSVTFNVGVLKLAGEWKINGFFILATPADQTAPMVSFGIGPRLGTNGTIGTLTSKVAGPVDLLIERFGPPPPPARAQPSARAQ